MNGVFSALLCAFGADGHIDVPALRKIIDYNIDVCKIDGLYVNGSTGESFNMPLNDRKIVIRETAAHVNGRVKLIAQIGCNVIDEIYELCDLCTKCGYDAVSAVAPFYYPYSKYELIAHYKRIASYSKLPLIIYNIPIRTGVVLTRADFLELLSIDNIAGVKFTSNDFFLLEQVRCDFPNKLIYSGFDEMLFSAAILGTNGAIGSTYNIIGFWAKEVMAAVHASDNKTALAAQHKINTVVEMLLEAGLFQTLKATMTEYGADCGECRMPMGEITFNQRKAAAEIRRYIEMNK